MKCKCGSRGFTVDTEIQERVRTEVVIMEGVTIGRGTETVTKTIRHSKIMLCMCCSRTFRVPPSVISVLPGGAR